MSGQNGHGCNVRTVIIMLPINMACHSINAIDPKLQLLGRGEGCGQEGHGCHMLICRTAGFHSQAVAVLVSLAASAAVLQQGLQGSVSMQTGTVSICTSAPNSSKVLQLCAVLAMQVSYAFSSSRFEGCTSDLAVCCVANAGQVCCANITTTSSSSSSYEGCTSDLAACCDVHAGQVPCA
jgi:hypothetical protein